MDPTLKIQNQPICAYCNGTGLTICEQHLCNNCNGWGRSIRAIQDRMSGISEKIANERDTRESATSFSILDYQATGRKKP